MGKRKQPQPRRSGEVPCQAVSDSVTTGGSSDRYPNVNDEKAETFKVSFVEIDASSWASEKHFDIAEVRIRDEKHEEWFRDADFVHRSFCEMNFSLRLRVLMREDQKVYLGNWPLLAAENVFLECVVRKEGEAEGSAGFFGGFDGSDKGVTGLVHLIHQKFLTVRLVMEDAVAEDFPSFRARIEILQKAFDSCDSLYETTKAPWKRSMMNLMEWLRPEVLMSELRYGISSSEFCESYLLLNKGSRFDASKFYEAISPSKGEPILQGELPDLLPQLRPYQRRAAYWMVQRETKVQENPNKEKHVAFPNPMCVPVLMLDQSAHIFYNPFRSCLTADEMGLGKTVELLACILANRKVSTNHSATHNKLIQGKSVKNNMNRLRRERVECVCGALSESIKYRGLWVQCDVCDAWQHADCVGFDPRSPAPDICGTHTANYDESAVTNIVCNTRKKNGRPAIKFVEKNYVCKICMERIQAADYSNVSDATLVVCPSPILPQWKNEIAKHTRTGSLKTCVYEGVKSSSSHTSFVDMDELVRADIVLTTYDVLKEDLSHDHDGNGCHHVMRFKKRYPVVPTPLTRIYWWRICLDEAQMVESTAASATEMASRLRGEHRWCITGTPIQKRLQDMYGLLRFLRASPFDLHKWWSEVIQGPYEVESSLHEYDELSAWWMQALDLVEKNGYDKELMNKIDEALPGVVNGSKLSKFSSRFQTLSGLKYVIQTGLDSQQISRKGLLDRLLDIDETMENPRAADVERVRYCSNCQPNGSGPLCVHCEVDDLFRAYEARLFLLTKGGNEKKVVASAEEALDLQKQKSALNRFFGDLAQSDKSVHASTFGEEGKRHRDIKWSIVISRSPSELELMLGVLKSFSKFRGFGKEIVPWDFISKSSNKDGKTSSKEQLDEEACPVCHEKLGNQKMVFECGHVTCCQCLIAMTEHSFVLHGRFQRKWVMCPKCRVHTNYENIAYVDDDQNQAYETLRVHGSYGTKIEAVTMKVMQILSTDPLAKILVFSSWNAVLDVLEHALDANSISFVRMKGGMKSHAALREFKEGKVKLKENQISKNTGEPRLVQVLLLLIQHGANGLNLLEDQHVILVEPLLNPSVEAQAINRVHRIGQEKATFVHRFIVKSTVEESIYKLSASKTATAVVNTSRSNQEEPTLTVKDLESLFSCENLAQSDEAICNSINEAKSLHPLPPAVAAALAAENRLRQGLRQIS